MTENIGDRFQQDTKYDRRKMNGVGLDWDSKPQIYKEYPESNKLKLPKIESFDLPKMKSLDEVLKLRRSVRQFCDEPMSLGQLSYLLWASTGIQRLEYGNYFRTAPSAGGLYPIETYLIINNVARLENGVYHYSIKTHELDELKVGNFGKEISYAALNQGMCAAGAAVFVHTAIFQRSKWKYKQRAYRYIYLDAGHIAENLALAAVAIELGSCHIGAIFDDEANKLVDVDGENESVVYLTVVGRLD